jgi:hypothetical protein
VDTISAYAFSEKSIQGFSISFELTQFFSALLFNIYPTPINTIWQTHQRAPISLSRIYPSGAKIVTLELVAPPAT